MESLYNAGVTTLLRQFLSDPVPSIQHSAAIAVGRLANHSEDFADSLIASDIVDPLVANISQDNKYFKKAAAIALKGISRHTERHASAVVQKEALPVLIACMKESADVSVKEAAVSAIGQIARHTEQLAKAVIGEGVLPLLLICCEANEASVKRTSYSTVLEIAKHSEPLARAVLDLGFLPCLIKDLEHVDVGTRKNVTACLSNLVKHSVDICTMLLKSSDPSVLPRLVVLLKDESDVVKKNVAIILRDVCKDSLDLCKQVVAAGAVGGLGVYIGDSTGISLLPAIICLGYIASYSETLAQAIILSNVVPLLSKLLINEPDQVLKSATAWTLCQVARHSSEHSKSVTEHDVLRKLLALYTSADGSGDLKDKTKRALKIIISQTTNTAVLEPMLSESPLKIQKSLLRQFAKVLPNDIAAKKSFIQSGCLKQTQLIAQNEPMGSKIRNFVAEINAQYPPEIVNYYSPQYGEVLLKKLEEHSAKMKTVVGSTAGVSGGSAAAPIKNSDPLANQTSPKTIQKKELAKKA